MIIITEKGRKRLLSSPDRVLSSHPLGLRKELVSKTKLLERNSKHVTNVPGSKGKARANQPS